MLSKTKHKGFTLLELILVMIVLCTVLAMAAPSLRGFFASREISDVSHNIVTLMNYAASQAVAESNYYRLNYNKDTQECWLTRIEDGRHEMLRNSFGMKVKIPADIKVDLTDWDSRDGWYSVEFNPLGRKSIGRMRLINAQETTVDIFCQSETEPYQVIEYNEESQEVRYQEKND